LIADTEAFWYDEDRLLACIGDWMFEKILACLDGSPLAEQILPHLIGGGFGKVILLKVVDTSVINLPIGVPGGPAIPVRTKSMEKRFQDELSRMPDYLEKLAQPLRDKGLDVECVVLQGIPSETIITYAKENKVNLIAMATHGHSGLRQVVMGSTVEYVVKHGGLPVLLVTPQKR